MFEPISIDDALAGLEPPTIALRPDDYAPAGQAAPHLVGDAFATVHRLYRLADADGLLATIIQRRVNGQWEAENRRTNETQVGFPSKEAAARWACPAFGAKAPQKPKENRVMTAARPAVAPAGTILTGKYKGQQHSLLVTDAGFILDGDTSKVFKSLSTAGGAVTGGSVNGHKFWKVPFALEVKLGDDTHVFHDAGEPELHMNEGPLPEEGQPIEELERVPDEPVVAAPKRRKAKSAA